MIRLPWPPKQLSPNARCDRRAISGIRSKYRQDCAWIVKAFGLRYPPAPLHLRITFLPPDDRRRDMDNMFAAIKSGIDGIADATGVDDSWYSYTLLRGDSLTGGAVLVEINPPVADAVLVPIVGVIR
jgi:crossover junction endodeoxyribonuclease RusA